MGDVKCLRERQVRTIGSSLIPSLGGGSNGTQRDRVPQHNRTVPLMGFLVGEGILLVFVKLRKAQKPIRLARDQSRSAKEVGVLFQAITLGESLGLFDSFLSRDALEKGKILAFAEDTNKKASHAYLERIFDDIQSDRSTARRVCQALTTMCLGGILFNFKFWRGVSARRFALVVDVLEFLLRHGEWVS